MFRHFGLFLMVHGCRFLFNRPDLPIFILMNQDGTLILKWVTPGSELPSGLKHWLAYRSLCETVQRFWVPIQLHCGPSVRIILVLSFYHFQFSESIFQTPRIWFSLCCFIQLDKLCDILV